MKKNKKKYALKEIYKAEIIDRKLGNYVNNERDILSRLKHP